MGWIYSKHEGDEKLIQTYSRATWMGKIIWETRRGWEDIIKIYLKERCKSAEWIHPAKDRVK
jgi:hypothetical protein